MEAQEETQNTETQKKETKQREEKTGAKLTVTSKVKELIKNHEMNCGSDFGDALDKEVEVMVRRAVGRAKSNDRKTVRSGDL